MSALGAKGTDEEFRAALGYLAAHFPAQELPRINLNTATAIELESGLTLRRSQDGAARNYSPPMKKSAARLACET